MNSCHSLAQTQLPQLLDAIHDHPDSPLLYSSPKGSAHVHSTHPSEAKESPNMKIPAIPESVKNFLEDSRP